ncbi:protein EARLY RESPONSIVE TO DEHYDRATION 15 isoform X1 [Musa acuminata AAA Group]|uniref:protein EARLY RESPONSIVE TO DEHYDRATION 15 isoform X1 n=2 Tax=Musa acuminata AAA Group TaxID=214697 RepID=UPI0031E2E3D2
MRMCQKGSNDWETMSTMAASSGATGKSMLNPDAPLFIPMAFQQVEDFSAEWWELVKTTTWFREHWLHQHQDQETFDAADDDEDVINLLPDSFDLGVGDESSILEAEHDDAAGDQISMALKKERIGNGVPSDAEAVARSLGVESPKNGSRSILEPTKHREKPAQRLSPRCGPHHVIQQPR